MCIVNSRSSPLYSERLITIHLKKILLKHSCKHRALRVWYSLNLYIRRYIMSEKKKGIFSWYFNTSLLLRIFIGLILGAIVGLIAGPAISWISPVGKIFVNLLKMIVMPVVLSSLIVGAASINPSILGKVGIKILIFYLLTSAFAVAIGLILGNLLNVGAGLDLSSSAEAAGKVLTKPKLGDTLINIIPKNPFGAIARGEVLPIISLP